VRYAVVGYRDSSDDRTPGIETGVPALLLAAPTEHPSWGLFAFSDPCARAGNAVRPALADLLDRALEYPPAVALARDDMLQAFASDSVAVDRFLEEYEAALARRLDERGHSPARMLVSCRDHGPDLRAGRLYWVIDERPASDDQPVRWISRDYYVYVTRAGDFVWPGP
jgi:hypothetical protein